MFHFIKDWRAYHTFFYLNVSEEINIVFIVLYYILFINHIYLIITIVTVIVIHKSKNMLFLALLLLFCNINLTVFIVMFVLGKEDYTIL